MKYISLIHDDCLVAMKNIADKSVDMVLCDLPYGTTACKWDVIIPFDKLWEQYKRIIKDIGVIVLFGKEPFSSLLRVSNIDMFKYDWIWEKDTKSNFMQANYQPLNNIEIISVFSKAYAREIEGKNKITYNPQFVIGQQYKIPKTSKTTEIFATNHKNGKYEHTIRDTSQRYPYVTIKINSVKGKDKKHPTQKPVALLEYLIKTYSNEGDTILDNCAGSFSTAIAAINTNRCFIGIEKEENYFNIGVKRVKERLQSDVFAQDFELAINYK